jgi:hypothetical protein
MSALKDNLRKLYRIQNQIDALNEEKNILRQKLEKQIVKEKLVGKRLNLGNRTIVYEEKNTMQGLTQSFLAESLHDYYGDGDIDEARRVFDFILKNRKKIRKMHLEMRKKGSKGNQDE